MTRISSDKAVLFEKVGASPGLEVRVMTDASPRRHPIQRGADAADSQALPLMGKTKRLYFEMDPLTSAVTVSTVIDWSAKLLSTCYRYYREVKGAKKEIQSIISEVSSLHEVLKSVEQLGKSASPSQLTALHQLKKPDGPLNQCQRSLCHLISKLDSHHVLTWPFKSSEVKSSLVTIDRLKSTFTLALSTDQVELQLSSEFLLSNISDDMTQQKDVKIRQDIISWLSTTKPSSNQNINRRKHQPGTGEWFVNGTYFEEWRNTPNSLIWLYGNAGCGKSILASTIIDYIQDHHVVRGRSALAYFYFDFNDTLKQKVTNFMSSILADLCAQTNLLTDTVKQMYSKCNDGHREPPLSDLESAFLSFLPAFDKVFIIVDALDECPSKDNERQEVLRIIENILRHTATNLHLTVTSRQYHDIETVIAPLASIPPIHIESAMIESDIKLYVQSEVQAIRTKRAWWHVELCKEVEEALLRGAKGMFRWVYCQLDTLKSCRRVADVRDKLKKLPRDLEDTYVQMLAAIPEDYREDAHNALRWLVFSERPLLLQELVEALRIDPQRSPPLDEESRLPDHREILDILPNLVNIYEKDYESRYELPTALEFLEIEGALYPIHVTEIELAHFSVQEFLLSYATKASDRSPLLASVTLNHSFITEACLHYINFYEESEYRTELAKDYEVFPLVQYAFYSWRYHYFAMRDQDDEIDFGNSRSVDDLLFKLCTLDTERRDWLNTYRAVNAPHYSTLFYYVEDSLESTPLYFASFYGLYRMTERLLDHGQDVNAEGGPYGAPLNAGCLGGHRDVARVLLDRGAEINRKSHDYGLTALHLASESGNVSVVRLLLDRGASIHLQDSYGDSPFICACRSGDCETMELLLDHGASIEPADSSHQTPLLAAVRWERYSAIKLLLDRGASIHLQNEDGDSPFTYACRSGDCEIMKLLLDHGASIEPADSLCLSPLMAAVISERYSAIKLLLDRGADIDQLSWSAIGLASALRYCARYGKTETAALLLDRGANIDIEDDEGETPLKMAIQSQKIEMVKLLVERGANVFVRDEEGPTPLEYSQKHYNLTLDLEMKEEQEIYEGIIAILTKAEEAQRRKHSTESSQQDSTGPGSVSDEATDAMEID